MLLGSKRIQQRIYFEYGRHRETKPFLCFIQHPADRVELILIDKALEDGYSTADEHARSLGFGEGMGFSSMQKYSDEMHIYSEAGIGTTLIMKVFVNENK